MASIVEKVEGLVGIVGGIEALIPLVIKLVDDTKIVIADAKIEAPTLIADGDAIKLKIEAIFKSL